MNSEGAERFKVLKKANDEGISFCKCNDAFALAGQADCPWCGCGWLFTCVSCRKAFTFAIVADADLSPADIARRDVEVFAQGKWDDEWEEEVVETTRWLVSQIEPLEQGTVCVYLDGKVIPYDSRDIAFSGYFARHKFDHVPHRAGARVEEMEGTIGSPDYWFARELPDEEKVE